MLRAFIIFTFLLFSLSLQAAEPDQEQEFIVDPFDIESHLPCPMALFEVALQGVIATHVYGQGPVTIATLYDIERRGNQKGVPYAIKDFKERLVNTGISRLTSPPITRAVQNANQMDHPIRLVVCLLAEGCVLPRDHSVLYVQFAEDEPGTEDGAAGQPNTDDQPPKLVGFEPKPKEATGKKETTPKKKVASKGAPKKKPVRKMVAHRKIKLPEPPLEEIIGDAHFPRILLIAEGGRDLFSEGIFTLGLVRSLVVFSEGAALENWKELNRLSESSDEDELYRRVKPKLKEYELLHRQIMVAISEDEVRRQFLKDSVTGREEFEAMQRAFQKYQALGISLDDLAGEEITSWNIFNLFEKLAAAYVHS